MGKKNPAQNKIKVDQVVVVEGRDDVSAVSMACDALIIATHGFGITKTTWEIIEKAYREKGIIILTDPDFSGEEIRRKLNAKFPNAINAYVARADASSKGDIGIENSKPETIAESIVKAIENACRKNESFRGCHDKAGEHEIKCGDHITINILVDLGLVSCKGSQEMRQKVCDYLGIGYGNAKTFLKKLKGFNIGIEELKEAVYKSQQ